MAYQYKKRRYKIKPIPVIIALLILIALIFGIGTMIKSIVPPKSSNDAGSTGALSSTNLSSLVDEDTSSLHESSGKESSKDPMKTSSSEMDTSSTVTSTKDSSQISSSEIDPSSIVTSTATSSQETSSTPATSHVPTGELPTINKSDWNLILLNNDNKIDTDLNIEKTKFNTQYVDSRAAQAYTDMCAAAQKESITLYLRSGYRSVATQKQNYNNAIAKYESQGNSKDEAIRLTNQYYAVPGHSEHHTGLAFDIITPEYHDNIYTLNEQFAKTAAYDWLLENSAEYGFILRFPADKQDITGINFEPWHYRYVGIEHAQYITDNKLCLEEYLQL